MIRIGVSIQFSIQKKHGKKTKNKRKITLKHFVTKYIETGIKRVTLPADVLKDEDSHSTGSCTLLVVGPLAGVVVAIWQLWNDQVSSSPTNSRFLAYSAGFHSNIAGRISASNH